MKRIICILAILLTVPACSVYKAMSQEGPANLEGIGVDSTRIELIYQLGAPKATTTLLTGQKQDIFEFKSGFEEITKLRVIPYMFADLATLGLSEIVLYPLEESILDSATCTGVAIYNNKWIVENWKVVVNRDSSQQVC